MPKLIGGQAWPVCGPGGWNPVDKTGPWFSPSPDGAAGALAAPSAPPAAPEVAMGGVLIFMHPCMY